LLETPSGVVVQVRPAHLIQVILLMFLQMLAVQFMLVAEVALVLPTLTRLVLFIVLLVQQVVADLTNIPLVAEVQVDPALIHLVLLEQQTLSLEAAMAVAVVVM
jgi:hypothetical protein